MSTFRIQLDELSARFIADYKRRNALACAEVFTEDALLLLPGSAPIRGRVEIAAAITASLDAGRAILGLTTTDWESDGAIGYAVQTVHSNAGDGTVMLALRCEDDGAWRVCVEAVMR